MLLVVLGAAAVIRRAWWGISAVLVADHGLVRGVRPAADPGVGGRRRAGPDGGDAEHRGRQHRSGRRRAGPGGLRCRASSRSRRSSGPPTALPPRVLDAQYDNHAMVSTVGLWSYWPMDAPEPLELGLSWARALRVVVHHPEGDIAVYAVHLPSVRPGDTDGQG